MLRLLLAILVALVVATLLLRPRATPYATLIALFVIIVAFYVLLLGYINAVEALILGAVILILLVATRSSRPMTKSKGAEG